MRHLTFRQSFLLFLLVLVSFFSSESLSAKEAQNMSSFEKPSQDVKLLVSCGPDEFMCNCHNSGVSPSVSNIDVSADNMCNLITHNFHYCEVEGSDCDCNKVN